MVDEPTVFLVDDDSAVLELLETQVTAVFPRVERHTSASAFLAAYDPLRPGCLVCDVAMPGMSGLELQHQLSLQGIELPVIFLSGYSSVRMAVAAMQAGAVSFLEKPPQAQELWDNIRKALDLDRRRRHRRAQRVLVQQRFAQLTRGERTVLNLILAGKLNKEIAAELGLSVRTIEDRRGRLMQKMQADSVAQLVQAALLWPGPDATPQTALRDAG